MEAGHSTDAMESPQGLLRRFGTTLNQCAANAILQGLKQHEPPQISLDQYPPPLHREYATFVTLERHARLRGCIGSIAAHRALIVDIALNAYAAAFSDRRFDPVTSEEVQDITVSFSVLAPARPLAFETEEDLLAQLVPGETGLILEESPHRGVFLPQVWDNLPDPGVFLKQLKRKAGLPEEYWSATVSAKAFTVAKSAKVPLLES